MGPGRSEGFVLVWGQANVTWGFPPLNTEESQFYPVRGLSLRDSLDGLAQEMAEDWGGF